MPSSTPKDHYVPQFYLDAFAIEGAGAKTPHIYQYMDDNVVQPRIKDVASEKHFYTFKDKLTGAPIRDIDNFFSQVESNASNPLKKIINEENINLTDQELEHLSIFLAVLAVRTPGFIKSQESLREEAIKEFQAFQATNKDFLKRKYEEAGVKLTDQQLDEQQKFALKKEYSISFPNSKDFFLGTGLKYSMEFSEWYYQIKHWHLIIADNRDFFITSDNPFSVYRPVYVPPIYNAGYGNGTLIITISPKLALLLRDLPLKDKIIKVNSYFVKKINKNIIRFSDNYIYANKKSQKIETLFRKTARKAFQKSKVTRIGWAPFVMMGPPPVPEEIFH